MRTVYAAIRTYREERDVWEQAYYELKTMDEAYRKSMQSQLAGLRKELEEERVAWKASIRRARGPGFGIFAGVGYTGSGAEAVVGVGIVWKVF